MRATFLAWPIAPASKIFCLCNIPQLTLNKVAGARDAVNVTDWRFKASVMISSGEDYIRRVCHVDGWWMSLVCVCVKEEKWGGAEEVRLKGQECLHARVLVYRCICVRLYMCAFQGKSPRHCLSEST